MLIELLLGKAIDKLIVTDWKVPASSELVAHKLASVIAQAERIDKGLGGIAKGLLKRNPAERLTAVGILKELHRLGMGAIGNRAVMASFDTPVPLQWVQKVRKKKVRGFGETAAKAGAASVAVKAALAFAEAKVPNPHHLTKDEVAAIYLYTTDEIYHALNKALRDGNEAERCKFLSYSRLLLSALDKLPSWSGVVYRGIEARLGEDEYAKQEEMIWPSFSSCSEEGEAVMKGFLESSNDQTLFAIAVRNGKSVAEFSEHGSEAEILLPLGVQLRVDNKIRLHERLMLVNLTEYES